MATLDEMLTVDFLIMETYPTIQSRLIMEQLDRMSMGYFLIIRKRLIIEWRFLTAICPAKFMAVLADLMRLEMK
jgi:hypothetical protein